MAEEKAIDETVPGGEYIVNGKKVDAEGKEIGKVTKAEAEVDSTPVESDAPDGDVAKKKK